MKINLPLLLLLMLGGCATHSTIPTDADLVIENARLIRLADGSIQEHARIVIKDDRILALTDSNSAPQFNPKRRIDAAGRYIIPGLWDMHVHFGGGQELIQENKDLLPLYLAYGVTSVRDCAADLSDSVLDWRHQINSGELLGPTLFTSGPKLEGKNSVWAGDLEVETLEEMDQALDKLQAMGVDFVKITDSALTPALYLAAVNEVKKRGMKISGHIPFALSVTEVSDGGLDAIEHLTYLLKAGAKNEADISRRVQAGELDYWSALPMLRANFDQQTALGNYRRLAHNGTAVVPTLIGSQIIAHIDENDHLSDSELDYIGPGLKATYSWRVKRAGEKAAKDPGEIIERKARFRDTAALLPLLDYAGVNIIAGTDAGYLNSYIYPGKALHDELAIYVDNGLTPLRALQSAVLAGPDWLGKSTDYGDLAPGKKADILLLDANPLDDIRHSRKIFAVVSQGRFLDRTALDAILSHARAKNSDH